MRNIFLFIFLLSISIISVAQKQPLDKIVMKNYDIIRGIIIENHSPDYLIINSVSLGRLTIDYKDIRNAYFLAGIKTEKEKDIIRKERSKYKYFSVATGLGYSYAGVGIRLQYRIGGKAGMAFHLGVGYNEYEVVNRSYSLYESTVILNKSGVNFSGGLKLMFLSHFYINTSVLFHTLDFSSYPNREGHYDLNILLGADWFFNDDFGINAAFGISSGDNNFIIDFEKGGAIDLDQLAIDIGLVYKIPSFKKK